jgi:hypothetical protein
LGGILEDNKIKVNILNKIDLRIKQLIFFIIELIMTSIDSILYYNNETEDILFDFDEDLNFSKDYEIRKNDQLLVIFLYLGVFYHLGWYIVSMFQRFSYQDLSSRIEECKTLFNLLNDNYNMFEKDNIDKMDTNKLLDNFIDYLDKTNSTDSCSSDNASNMSEEETEFEYDSEDDIEAADILTSMGKDWEFNN